MFGMLERDMKNIEDAIREFQEIDEVIVFGSRAMGNNKKASDVDIAVKGNEVTRETVIRLSGILNEEKPIPYFFDVVDYNSIGNDELKKHIDMEGKVIYKKWK